MANIITRRSFLKAGLQSTVAAGLASLTNVPLFLQRALAEGNIGLSGKKLLFIFLRGGNDGINNLIPINDPAYLAYRPTIGIPKDPLADYTQATGQADNPGILQPFAIRLGNGFAALNPNLFDLIPLFNAGQLALIHRAGYVRQSRSHFDSEIYWEKATDGIGANYRSLGDGVFYRTIVESGWNRDHALSGVSVQSTMPQSLRGEQPLTNLSTIADYNVLGTSGTTSTINGTQVAADRIKLLNAISAANGRAYPTKDNREAVLSIGQAFRDTLDIFQDPAYGFASNEFRDEQGRLLFNISNTYYKRLKAAAQVLASTDAIIAGTQLGGFDLHTSEVTVGIPHQGAHANLLRQIGWTFYALQKYFSNPSYSPRVRWEDVVVITFSEFGRTSAENASVGTDHAEASVMYVGGGSIHGGVYGCDTNNNLKLGGPNWTPCTAITTPTPTVQKDGSLFAESSYLKRAVDYRSVLGEIIRDHLGATQDQLNRIIPGYANESAYKLKDGGVVVYNRTNTPTTGELGLI